MLMASAPILNPVPVNQHKLPARICKLDGAFYLWELLSTNKWRKTNDNGAVIRK